MKKTTLLSFFLCLFTFVMAQPKITNLSYPKSADLFGLYEISFSLGNYDNPYDPDVIDVYAEFVSPDDLQYRVNGFYYESYTFNKKNSYEVATRGQEKGWRVRFTPNCPGNWTFIVHAIDRQGETKMPQSSVSFLCNPIDTSKGFISVANKRYLKRDAMVNGRMEAIPFYPIGPNVAWYGYKGSQDYPKGIYDYDFYINEMAGSANYMRIWLTRYQYLSLYGPEYTQMNGKKNMVYFDSSLNQKDAAELDHIIEYAAQNDIAVMPCIFTYGDFGDMNQSSSRWDNNPYKTELQLTSPTQFFTDKRAKRIAKNLVRYIVARWGYATNIVCWELWNEVNNISSDKLPEESFHTSIVMWHSDMADYIRTIDPFNHPISTSLGTFSEKSLIGRTLYKDLDIVQFHNYGNIQKAKSKEQRTKQLFDLFTTYHPLYPNKPLFCGEFGFGQSKPPKYQDKDPHGFDTHNCAWASLFSGSMGSASFWFWDYLREKELLRIYAPVLAFSKNIPILSDTFTPLTTTTTAKNSLVCPNGIETYYLASANEDTLYGWCQDTAFSYQALRRLTDTEILKGHFVNDAKCDTKGYVYTLNQNRKPKPCSNSNVITIPISKQDIGTQYIVRWFDGETGLEIAQEKAQTKVKRAWWSNPCIEIMFPSTIRDLKNRQINNTYGDAAFIVIAEKDKKEGSNTQGTAPNKRIRLSRFSKTKSNQ